MNDTTDWNRKFEQESRYRRKTDLSKDLINHHRLLCDGVVISSSPKHLEEFGVGLLRSFKNNLFNAQMDHNFVFAGAGPKLNGREYVEFHEKRLGIELSTNFEIVPPGEWFPLAPNRDNIN